MVVSGVWMPGWSPNWEDVAFDHVAADTLSSVARRVAERLDADADVRAHLTRQAAGAWEGRLARDAEDRASRIPPELGRIALDLLVLADAVEESAVAARLDQQRREDGRERWRAERARERESDG